MINENPANLERIDYTLDMTLSYNPCFSPVRHLLTRLNIHEGCSATELAYAINQIPIPRGPHASHPLHVIFARLAIREFGLELGRDCLKQTSFASKNASFGFWQADQNLKAECQTNALKHYQKLARNGALSRQHIETCIQSRLQDSSQIDNTALRLSAQALLQMIAPHSQPVETITIREWTDCAMLLYQKCSTTS